MKKQWLPLGVSLILLALFCVNLANRRVVVRAQEKQTGAKRAMLLRHVVLFKFKSEVSPAQIREVVEAFSGLPRRITTIEDFEWGTDVSVEDKAEGFTHCFLVSFRTAQARDEYLPHPAHQEFVQLVGPRLEKVLVVDYWAR
jgi:hypothetical protein